jgi:hypothetical protein
MARNIVHFSKAAEKNAKMYTTQAQYRLNFWLHSQFFARKLAPKAV